jgi:hypothetical protein
MTDGRVRLANKNYESPARQPEDEIPGRDLATHVDAARTETSISIAAARLLDIARHLHDTPDAAFDHLT